MQWQVTLYNTHAQCGIRGPIARTKQEAYRGAIKRAGDEFLYHRGTSRDYPREAYDLYWPHCAFKIGRNSTSYSVSTPGREYTIELRRA